MQHFTSYIIFSLFLILFVSPPASSQNADNGRTASLAIDQRDGDQYGWAIQYDSQSSADKRQQRTEGNDGQGNSGCG